MCLGHMQTDSIVTHLVGCFIVEAQSQSAEYSLGVSEHLCFAGVDAAILLRRSDMWSWGTLALRRCRRYITHMMAFSITIPGPSVSENSRIELIFPVSRTTRAPRVDLL